MFLKIKSVDLSAGLWVNNAYCALRCAPFWEKECDLNTLRNCIPVRWNIYRTNRSLDTLTNLWNVLFFFCLVACYFLSRCILQPCVMSRCIRQTFGDQFVVSDTSRSQQIAQDTFFFFSVVVIGISSQNYVVFKGCTCCIFTWHTMQASSIFFVVF